MVEKAVAPNPAPRGRITHTRVTVVEDGMRTSRKDRLATEEPLEIRTGGPGQKAVSVAVTMRTPGNDFELAGGFLFSEGLVAPDDIATIRYCEDIEDTEQQFNVVTVRLRRPFDEALVRRNFYATSSCGVCGKASLDAVLVEFEPVSDGPVVAHDTLLGLPRTLREDVGRHNAMDKLIGSALLAGQLPLTDRIVLVSGRASFELVQKAGAAGIPIVCAVSAPSSLAVDLARRAGITLVGFLRGSRFVVYTHPERVAVAL
jgi:FdhD protein